MTHDFLSNHPKIMILRRHPAFLKIKIHFSSLILFHRMGPRNVLWVSGLGVLPQACSVKGGRYGQNNLRFSA